MDRRTFLKVSGTALTGALLPGPVWALANPAPAAERIIALQNIHTGESLSRVFWAEGSYIPEALASIDKILRDHRTDEVRDIDPALLEQLHTLALKCGGSQPFQIISGYRSPKTNESLRRAGHQTARKSFHLTGQAIDLRLPGVAHENLRRAALDLRAGGVGNYPGLKFVHLDTGPVRTW